MTVKTKTTKFISALLIISIILPTVLFSTPRQAQAQPGATAAIAVPVADIPQETAGWLSQALHAIGIPSTVMDTGLHIKDFAQFLLEQTLMHIAKAVLARITQATINWINSDFHGSPLFIENPASFFKDIAKSEIKNLVDMIGYDTFRFPFGKQTALNVIASYRSQLATNSQYTLSKVINDPRLLVKYRNDFNYGGWNGFLINTQYPQNNYLGFQGMIQQNLASRLQGTLQAPAQKIQGLLQQGMGFLSPQTCPSNPKYNNGVNEFLKPSFKPPRTYNPPEYTGGNYAEYEAAAIAYEAQFEAEVAAEKTKWAETNDCPGGLVNTTPGSVVGNHIMDAMGSNLRQTELGAALGNSLSAIFDALIGHFLDKGLNALASTVNPSPNDDNWSYEGQTLGSSNYILPASQTEIKKINIPEFVSVRAGQITSITISGGSGNYAKKTEPDTSKATAEIVSVGTTKKLSITGVAPSSPLDTSTRVTSVEIIDKSDSTVESAVVNIKVYANGALAVMQTNCLPSDTNNDCILTDTSAPFTTTIEGGTPPYSISKYPNEGVAIASLSDKFLIISGVNKGETSVVIKDYTNKSKTIEIVIDTVQDLSLPQDILVGVGKIINVPISGGTPRYSIETVFDPLATTIKIVDKLSEGSDPITMQFLEIEGLVAGQSGVIVKDSSVPQKRASANIKVEAASSTTVTANTNLELGNCRITKTRRRTFGRTTYTMNVPNMPEKNCIASAVGGVWTKNTP